MAFFIEQLRTVLPMVGFDLFKSSVIRQPQDLELANLSPLFELTGVGVSATARESDEGFTVLAGSTARREATATLRAGYRNMRDQLIADGKIVEDKGGNVLRFVVDASFPSPTAAAAVVLARSQNGLEAWIVRGTGQTYKQWRTEKLLA